MTPAVRFTGPWPTGIEAGVRHLVPGDIQIHDASKRNRGAVPWGDIAAMASATAAVLTVAIELWRLRRAGRKATEGTSTLDAKVKEQGLFGVEVETVREQHGDPRRLSIRIRDTTANSTYGFAVHLDSEDVSISIDRSSSGSAR